MVSAGASGPSTAPAPDRDSTIGDFRSEFSRRQISCRWLDPAHTGLFVLQRPTGKMVS